MIQPAELYADVLADERAGSDADVDADAGDEGDDQDLIDLESQAVIARSNRDAIDANARQTLTSEEIEQLKQAGTAAGKDLIAKLLLSHAALDQKTTFSLAKYKLLKTKKYIRRFTVVPLDVCALGNWLMDDKDAGAKILGLRDEMVALLGCWGNVHYGGADRFVGREVREGEGEEAKTDEAKTDEAGEAKTEVDAQPGQPDQPDQPDQPALDIASQLQGGRWLMVDDTGGLLVAAMAERMGILYTEEEEGGPEADSEMVDADGHGQEAQTEQPEQPDQAGSACPRKYPPDDLQPAFSLANTLTLVHANTQPNLAYLRYFGFDHADSSTYTAGAPYHPLVDHLLCLSWLQLLDPASDSLYAAPAPCETPEVVAAWKPARRGNYYRKRRRWARTRHVIDATRAGGFAGFVAASTLDPISVLRHALPLLAGGAPVAVYSPTLEPLAALADCFSVGRRTAWQCQSEAAGDPNDEHWPGSEAFPLNPMLLLGATVQTSRARKWQVLPGRTHPLMTARGGAEGYIFTGWKARPAEGRVAARGRFKRRRTAGGDMDTPE